MHKHPTLAGISKNDDDHTFNQCWDNAAELVTDKLRLFAAHFIWIYLMHSLIEFVGRPSIVEYKHKSDSQQRESWLEAAYNPSYYASYSQTEPFYPCCIYYGL